MTLREEALQIVNDTPDNLLENFVRYMKNFKSGKNASVESSVNEDEVFNKRAKAIAEIKEWQKQNMHILKSGIDWDKERDAAMEEKYGPFI